MSNPPRPAHRQGGYIYGFRWWITTASNTANFVDRKTPNQGAVESDTQHPPRLHAGGYGDPNTQLRHTLFVYGRGSAREPVVLTVPVIEKSATQCSS